MIIVVMGVSGSGKSTIGRLLADALDCRYLEGDLLHSEASIDAMSRGIALTDADRAPWLAAVHAELAAAHARQETLVVGCSALRESYRETLSRGVPVTWVYLRGSAALIASRLGQREQHFFDPLLLQSQMETLEPPRAAIIADVWQEPRAIVEQVLAVITDRPVVKVFDDLAALSLAAAADAAALIREVVRVAGRCSLVLSGGATPMPFHRELAASFRDDVPWADVHVFWSDERYVPHDDPRSNYGMARATLLDHVPCPTSNIHPMPTDFADPAAAARAYEETITAWFGAGHPVFDLAILGIGEDGHTASLFPHSPALDEQTRTVAAVTSDAQPPVRLTLTLPILTRSARSWFLVHGENKAEAVRRATAAGADRRDTPAAAMQGARGSVTWWLDNGAAARLPQQSAS